MAYRQNDILAQLTHIIKCWRNWPSKNYYGQAFILLPGTVYYILHFQSYHRFMSIITVQRLRYSPIRINATSVKELLPHSLWITPESFKAHKRNRRSFRLGGSKARIDSTLISYEVYRTSRWFEHCYSNEKNWIFTSGVPLKGFKACPKESRPRSLPLCSLLSILGPLINFTLINRYSVHSSGSMGDERNHVVHNLSSIKQWMKRVGHAVDTFNARPFVNLPTIAYVNRLIAGYFFPCVLMSCYV